MLGQQGRGQGVTTLRWICVFIACQHYASGSQAIAAPTVPTTTETRKLFHPAGLGNAVFGLEAALSNKYAGVLGVRTSTSSPNIYDAVIYDAESGQHLWTLSQPVPVDNVNFRFASLAIDGDLAVVGARYAHVPLQGGGVAYNAGAAFVYDLTTGLLKFKLVSDTPQMNFLLGSSVDILGNRIAVGGWGTAYVFDATTGAQLAKLNPSTPSGQFGISVALSESSVVVGANSDDSRGTYTGAAFTFDLATFAERSKFIPANAVAYDNFGFKTAVDGDHAISIGRGGAYLFDVNTGLQLAELDFPESSSPLNYSVDISGSTALLGDPVLRRATLFDWTTGEALQHLRPSSPAVPSDFGVSVGMAGGEAIVSAGGRAYQFQLVPEPVSEALFFAGLVVIAVGRSTRTSLRRSSDKSN